MKNEREKDSSLESWNITFTWTRLAVFSLSLHFEQSMHCTLTRAKKAKKMPKNCERERRVRKNISTQQLNERTMTFTCLKHISLNILLYVCDVVVCWCFSFSFACAQLFLLLSTMLLKNTHTYAESKRSAIIFGVHNTYAANIKGEAWTELCDARNKSSMINLA